MKKINLLLLAFGVIIFAACNGTNETGSTYKSSEIKTETKQEVIATQKQSQDLSAGEAIYKGKGICATCHRNNGQGMASVYPPLAQSDYIISDKKRAIIHTMYGFQKPIIINGNEYPGGQMQTTQLTNQEIVDVVNYILNSWGNNIGYVTIEEVKALRK